jgi:hypothetical protein
MIGTIRKHSKILWAIIITVVIITFVFWGSQPSNRGNRGEVDLGQLCAVDLNTVRPRCTCSASSRRASGQTRSTRQG